MDGDQVRRDGTLQDLLTAAQQALDKGDQESAHELWRAAAVANPYDERVWQGLLSVVTSEDDRKVCLENMVAINPNNVEARRQLRALKRDLRGGAPKASSESSSAEERSPEERRQTRALRREQRLREEEAAKVTRLPSSEPEMELTPLPHVRSRRSRTLVTAISAGLLAVALGLVLSVIIYGGILSTVKP